jgi:hypothetical protein
MKTRIILLSAVSMLALAACQREAQAPDSPYYNPDDNTVLAKLILNVSSASSSETKQTSSAVQAGGANFRGMQDVHLLTYDVDEVGPDGEPFLYDVTGHKATKDFDLGNMMLEGDATSTSGIRILQLALPLKTNTVLLYGRATRTGKDTDEKLGHVDATGEAVNVTLDNVTFSLKDRMNGKDAEFALFGDLMGRILTGIMNTGLEVHTAARGYKVESGAEVVDGRYHFWWPDDAVGRALSQKDGEGNYLPDGSTHYDDNTGITYTFNIGSITWRQLGDAYGAGTVLAPLAEVLGEAYHNIMTISSKTVGGDVLKELRSASSGSVLRLTEDLYGIMSRVADEEATIPTTAEEKIAQLLAKEIIVRASSFYSADASGKVTYKDFATIMSGVDALIPERSTAYYTGGTVKIDDSFFYRDNGTSIQIGFPQNLGLPLGAALMTFFNPHDASEVAPDYNVVQYLTEVPAYGVGGGTFPITNYRYPAELMYYTNSNIRTSSSLLNNDDFPSSTGVWWNDAYWSTKWNGSNKIESSTQSVGVAKTINYGTALMAAKVGYSSSIIYDNNHGLHESEKNNPIDVGGKSGQFEVTGIMIGGVCDQVGWNFLPKTNDFTKMIYDDLSYDGDDETPGAVAIPKYTATEADRYTKDIYTLTFDNYDSSKKPDKQNIVYIALEIKNKTGQDLWGELNVIRRDGTFYLVGALDPTDEDAVAKFEDAQGNINLSRKDFNYPPFDASGNTINAPRVFMQDYVTTVKLNFTQESLAHAYVTMPDLRAGQVSLGLSVDVNWQSGFVFDVNLGGGN